MNKAEGTVVLKTNETDDGSCLGQDVIRFLQIIKAFWKNKEHVKIFEI